MTLHWALGDRIRKDIKAVGQSQVAWLNHLTASNVVSFLFYVGKSFYYFLAHILLLSIVTLFYWKSTANADFNFFPLPPAAAQSPALTFREDHVNYQPTCLLFMLPGSPFVLEFTLPHLTQINSERSQSVIESHRPCLWLDLGIACNLVWPVRHAYIYSAIHSMNISEHLHGRHRR